MEEKSGMNMFGAWLKTALEEAGMTQADLARIMKADHGNISKIINGKRIPSGTTMMKILDIMDAHMEFVPN